MTTDADVTTSSGSSYFCAAAADVVETATALSLAEMAAVKQSGSSCFCAAVVDAATEMTAVVDVDANPEILTPDCHKLYQFYILNSYKASVRI